MKMTIKKYIAGLSALLLLTSLTACQDYLDINDDPYVPQVAEPHLYFPQIAYAMAEGEMFDSRFVGQYTQHWAWSTSNNNYDQHGSRVTGNSPTATAQRFRNHYWSVGSNLNQMIGQAEERGYRGYKGIATAIRAWSWLQATATYGPMAFRQAWDNSRTKYEYDSQEVIYDGVDALADEALAALESDGTRNDPRLADWDLIYGGDLTKWRKMVFALKARRANHLSNKGSYNADQVIALVDQAFVSNDDNFNVYFNGTSSATSNFLGASRANFNNYRQGRVVIELLDGTWFNGVADPRLPLMFSPNPDGDYYGVTPALGDTMPTGNRIPTLYGKYLFLDAAPYPLITHFELQFIKAEAAFKKGDAGLALDALRAGVRSHMRFVGVSDSLATVYVGSAAMPQAAADLTLAQIMSQKYVALYASTETWADLRRYDYSGQVFLGFRLPETLRPENDGKPVERCLPTQFSEYDWNLENITAVGGLENDYHTQSMWFTEP